MQLALKPSARAFAAGTAAGSGRARPSMAAACSSWWAARTCEGAETAAPPQASGSSAARQRLSAGERGVYRRPGQRRAWEGRAQPARQRLARPQLALPKQGARRKVGQGAGEVEGGGGQELHSA